jgi:hypothetical protein
MKKAGFFCMLLLCGAGAYGQYSDSVHYYTGLIANGTINNTDNSQSYLINNALRLGIRKKEVLLNSATAWVYGQNQQKRTNNDINSSLDFDVFRFIPHMYYWGLGNFTASYSLKINSQFQTGAGIAWDAIDKKEMRLNFSDGLLYEWSDIRVHDTAREQYQTFRNSFRLLFRWDINTTFHLYTMNFIQQSLDDKDDYIVKSNVELKCKLYKWLSLTSTYSYNRFNRTRKENNLFTYGLAIERYF